MFAKRLFARLRKTSAHSLRTSARGRRLRVRRQGSFEQLEDRRLLTSITWTGGSSGNWNWSWNWSSLTVPGSGDDVVIPATIAPTVTIDSDATARSVSVETGATLLINKKALSGGPPGSLDVQSILVAANAALSIVDSASLYISAATAANSTIDGTLTMNAGRLSAVGNGVTLTVNGAATLTTPQITASSGATINFPNLAGYDAPSSVSMKADGSGSTISLPNLTTLTAAGHYSGYTTFSAENGGYLSLDALASVNVGVNAGYVTLSSSGSGSRINLPSLASFAVPASYGQIRATGGGTLLVPSLQDISRASLDIEGSAVDLSTLNNLDGATIRIGSGAHVSFPGITSYPAAAGGGTLGLTVDGAGSTLSLPYLASLSAAVNFTASAGGDLELPALQSSTGGNVVFAASNTSSVINAPELKTLTGSGNRLSIYYGAGLAVPQLPALNNGTISDYGGTFDFSALANIDYSNVQLNVGQLSLPLVTSYTATASHALLSSGSGCILSLPNLSEIGGSPSVSAASGGAVDLPALTTVSGTAVRFYSSSASSLLNLPILASLTGSGDQLQVSGGGSISVPQLTTFQNGMIDAYGGSFHGPGETVDFPLLANIDNTSVWVNGQHLSLPLVTSYRKTTANGGLQTDGSASQLDLPRLSSLHVTTGLQFAAVNGSAIDLPALENVSSGGVQFLARDSRSVIQLHALTSLTGPSDQLVINNASIETPLLATFTRGVFNITYATVSYPLLTNFDGSSIWLYNSAQLTLAGLAAFNDTNPTASVNWNSGDGTQLNLPNLTTITGSQGMFVTAGNHAKVDLPRLAALPLKANLRADNGEIDIPVVAAISDADTVLNETNSGVIVAPLLARFESGNLLVSHSTASFPSLADIDGLAISVYQAGQVTLPKVTSFHSNVHRLWQANDPGSLLSLPNLATIVVPNGIWLNISNAAQLKLAGLQSLTSGASTLAASGTGTRIEMPELNTFTSSATSYVNQSNGGVVSFPKLDNLINVNLLAVNPEAAFTLLPSQTFYCGNFSGKTLVAQGSVSVLSGSPTISGGLQLDGLAALWIANNRTLAISSDLLGNSTNADQFLPLGTVLLNGYGKSAANPQHLEAMSEDLGAVAAGFQSNFAYGTLSVVSNGYVKLSDLAHNASPAGTEAVYADQLVLASGATLDLNNLHVYVHAAQVDATARVLNGAVTVLPSGGPLTLGTPTSAALTAAVPTNDWTFYGAAGQVITVQLNPNGNAYPLALMPQLRWGQATLLTPGGTSLRTGSSASDGALVTLSNITLPSDGTYTVRVQAPEGHASSVGNYVLAAYTVKTTVRPLTVNQQYSGFIADLYAMDKWTFSGTAGQQVRLHVVNSGGNVKFALTGPAEPPVFSGLTGDSPLVNLPANGNYVLTVESSGGATGGYSFELQQTSVLPLSLGGTQSGTFSGNGYAQLFTVTMPASELLKLNLDDTTHTDVNELYARFGAPPTRGDYDYRATATGSADQQLVVPMAAPGTWYVLVYGNHVTAGSTYTLQASTVPLVLTDLAPSRWATGSTATLVVTGSGFDRTTTVQLVAADSTVYTANSVSLDTFQQVSAMFNLAGVPQGGYTVRVARGDGANAQMPMAFTVTAPGQARLETKLILPGVLGRHVAATFYIQYANTGNVAMPAPLLVLASSVPTDLPLFTLDPARQTAGFWTSAVPEGFANTIQILGSGKVPGVLEPGESVTLPVYYAGMQYPWDFSHDRFYFDLRVFTADDTATADWAGLKTQLRPPGFSADAWDAVYGNLTAQLGSTWGGYVQMLANQAAYLGRLGESTSDVGRLWALAVAQADNALLPTSRYSTTADICVPSPGSLSLSFVRQEQVAINARYAAGPLGYGWTHNWQYSFAVAPDGTVTVTMPSGAQRVFQPDSRGTSRPYFSQPGDYGVLTAVGSGCYSLLETDGQIEFFTADGTLGYVQDIHGNRIVAGYDTDGRLTSLTSFPSGAATAGGLLTIAYNLAGLIESVTAPDGRTVGYTYDAGQLTRVQGYDGRSTQYAYGTTGSATEAHALTSIQYADGTHQYFTYDSQGRLAGTSLDGGAQPLGFDYNLGQVTLTDANQDATQYFFNEDGLLAKVIDPLGRVAFATYDANFHLTSATGPTGLRTNFRYDSKGNVASGTDPLGRTNSFTYTAANRLASDTGPDGHTTTYQYELNAAGNLIATQALYADGTVSTAAFNALGDPLSIINRKGQVINATYDPVTGSLNSRTLADGTAYAFGYDAHGNMVTAKTYDATGALTETITLTYDAGDRLTGIVYPHGQSLTYAYNAGGRRTSMVEWMAGTVSSTVNYQYDAVGRLSGLADGSGNPIVAYTYNILGQLVVVVNGSGTGSGMGPYSSPYTTYQYDAAGNLLHLVNYASGTIVNSRFDYTYNALGQVTEMATLDGAWSYSYDVSGQLTHAVFQPVAGSAVLAQELTYVYNAAGNRTRTIVNGLTTDYTSNAVNEYTSTSDGTAYTYDADGNLLAKTDASGTTTYTYDSLNRLTSVTSPTDSLSYQYDPLGNLATTTRLQSGQTTAQVTQNVVDPTGLGNIVGQYDGSGSLLARYTYGLGLVSQNVGGAMNYYQFDALGSAADLTDSTGATVNRYGYLPFGGTLYSSGNASNPFTFVGQFGVSTDGNGLFNMRARSYDPLIGQFTSNDPLGLLGGDTNLRRYVSNAPTLATDASGLTLWPDAMRADPQIGRQLLQNALEKTQVISAEEVAAYQAEVRAAQAVATASSIPPGALIVGAAATGVVIGTVINNNLSDDTRYLIEQTFTSEDISEENPAYQEQLARDEARLADIRAERARREANDRMNAAFVGWAFGLAMDNLDPPGGNEAAKGNSGVAGAIDPNSLVGPAGYGSQAFVANGEVLPYQVNFENDRTATAPAQIVTISEVLDTDLDPATLRLTAVGFGDTRLIVPAADAQHYETTVSMTYNGESFDVFIAAWIDLATRTVHAIFQSLKTDGSGLPPGVLTGFLPPEDGTGRGQGHLSYIVKSKADLPTGTEIRNVALIQFDYGEIIATNQIDPHDPSQGTDPNKECLNTIDAGAPASSVEPLPATTAAPDVRVTWSGQDDTGGSGIASFDVYVSDNGGPFTLWLDDTTETQAIYTGVPTHFYAFYAVATDNVGHVESKAAGPEAWTTIQHLPTTVLVTSDHSAGAVYGQSIAFTVSVASDIPDVGVPAGSAQLLVDGANFGPSVLLADGVATVTTSNLPAGSRSVAVQYTSDSQVFADGASELLSQSVTPAELTIRADDKTKFHWQPLPELTATYTGFVNGETAAALATLPALATTGTGTSPAGDYPITVCCAAAANYAITYVGGTLTVLDNGWQNPLDNYDVTGDGMVQPLDVLTVINYINSHPNDPAPPDPPALPPPFYDVNGDGLVNAQDVLLVINYLNSHSTAAASEAGEVPSAGQADDALAAALGWVDGMTDGGAGRAGADWLEWKTVDRTMTRTRHANELFFCRPFLCPPRLRMGTPAKRLADVDLADLAGGELGPIIESLAAEIGAAWLQRRA